MDDLVYIYNLEVEGRKRLISLSSCQIYLQKTTRKNVIEKVLTSPFKWLQSEDGDTLCLFFHIDFQKIW